MAHFFTFSQKNPHKVPRAREQLSKLLGKLDYAQRVICGFEGRLKSLVVHVLEHSK